MQFFLPSETLFLALGNNSILRPTLNWQIDNDTEAKFDAQLSHMSDGFSWKATSDVVAPEKGETVTVNEWVTKINVNMIECKIVVPAESKKTVSYTAYYSAN